MRTNKQLLLDVDKLTEAVEAEQHLNNVLTKDIRRLYLYNGGLFFLSILIAVGATMYFNTYSDETKVLIANAESKATEIANKFNAFKDSTLKLKEATLFRINKSSMLEDMKQYPQLSNKMKIQIVNTIFEEAERYNLNPLILYAICHVESSFRPWYEHSLVSILVNGKTIKTRAVGLCGIMWEEHKQELIDSGIADSRSDLFDPVINIKASALILNQYSKQELLKGSEFRDESALLRYFGGNYPSYVQKIENKMMEVIRLDVYRR
jgi:soluble lytic murein transglycosylase-like protein